MSPQVPGAHYIQSDAPRTGARPLRVSFRILASVLALALTSGCGDSSLGRMKDTFALALDQEGDLQYDPAQARDLPYATMEAYIGSAPAGMMVLGQASGSRLQWVSADRKVVTTEGGRILATAGLPSDLLKTRGVGEDPVTLPQPEGRTTRLVDLSYRHLYGLPVVCTWERGEEGQIDLRGRVVEATLWLEHCQASDIGWAYTNRFWKGHDGTVWKSEQHYAPDAPTMKTLVLKLYRP